MTQNEIIGHDVQLFDGTTATVREAYGHSGLAQEIDVVFADGQVHTVEPADIAHVY